MAEELMLLHGDLQLHIIQARNLPNMDLTFLRRLRRSIPCPTISSTADGGDEAVGDRDKKIHHHGVVTGDAYVTVSAPQTTLARTRVIANDPNPIWDEHFHIPLAHPMVCLEFRVKENVVFGAQIMGRVQIPASKIASGESVSGWFDIAGSSSDAALRIEMKFTPFESNPLYKQGIAGDPELLGVRHTYFPQRKGCSVKLYQDAHVSNNLELRNVELDAGEVYQRGTCWEDICHAISEAHRLIYIVGWSVFHKIRLIREPTRELPISGDSTLGDLLKFKSQEGVRVLLLVWDDKSSQDMFFLNTGGVMGTHDEETKKFFKHSSVICITSPRRVSRKLGLLRQLIVGNMFTHHQKCVLVDTQADGNNRRITAFLGGLDLCDGRYDTPEHRLFHDLDTVFQDDFHQPTFPPGTKAPRQPWHDLHCRIEGPAAYDVLINFAQRWRRATRWKEFTFIKKGQSKWFDDAMVKLGRISWILSPAFSITNESTLIPGDDPNLYVKEQDQSQLWHVQIFRSIDSCSVKGFPKRIDIVEKQNLICGKNFVVDKSIETAYIQAIRSAQNFIYIENQYFIGSSYAWPSYKDAGADHLIPMELALKVVSKIRAKERFAIYIVVPMWPEGDPKSAPMQEVLFWQSQTIQMMYRVISQEIKSMQLDAHPLHYLNFYCLGRREDVPSSVSQSITDTDQVSDSFKSQRFMIYVHSKGMIVDDEYVIVGSANINQRSMAGSKDTEIAMGAYQPRHTQFRHHHRPRGQVYGYRMSLWEEHMGTMEGCFEEPESLECVTRVNAIAVENWRRYIGESEFNGALQGHLLKYPLDVDEDGKVSPIFGHDNFPDVRGKVMGSHTTAIPDVLTT